MSLNIVFAGTPDFADIILKRLLSSHHHVQAVFTQPDRPAGRGKKLQMSPVKQTALSHDIPVHQPLNFKTHDSVDTLKQLEADLMIVVAYGLILPEPVLNAPKLGCLNVHASLLPRWRGAAPIQRAILAGDKTTGISIMAMDEGLDTGPVYSDAQCTIEEADTAQSLHDKLAELGSETLLDTLTQLEKNQVTPIPQSHDGVTYAHKLKKVEAKIHWQLASQEIERQVRAFNPWPIAFTQIGDKALRVWEAKHSPDTSSANTPGEILSVDDGIKVATGQGSLLLTQLQLPGKKACSASELVRGYPELFAVGNTFL